MTDLADGLFLVAVSVLMTPLKRGITQPCLQVRVILLSEVTPCTLRLATRATMIFLEHKAPLISHTLTHDCQYVWKIVM